MARGRGYRAGGGTARPRRPMDWIVGHVDSVDIGQAMLAPTCKWLCDPAELRDEFTDPTLMAVRVAGQVSPGSATSGQAAFGFGIIAWNFATDGAGNSLVPTECPRLFDEECQDEDWIYRNLAVYTSGFTGYFTVNGEDGLSKARRRLGNDKGLLLVVQSATAADQFNFHYHVRALIKE